MVTMPGLSLRLLIAAGLSLLLLPLGLVINPELGLGPLVGLWLGGTLLGGWGPTFRVLLWGSVCCAVLIAAVVFTPLTRVLTEGLIVNEAPQKADLIVVLGGGMHCGAGQLEASSLARLEKGLELWQAGYAPRITLSDTVGEIFGDGNCPSLGLAAQQRVKALYGDEGPEVFLLPQMRTTRTEALAVAQLIRERGWGRVLLVTTPTHSRRSAGTFRNLGLEVVSVVSTEPRFDMAFTKPADRLRALTPVTREYLGLLTYGLRGWL